MGIATLVLLFMAGLVWKDMISLDTFILGELIFFIGFGITRAIERLK